MLDAGMYLDEVWPCNCWFCRFFTRPILSYFIKSAYVEEVETRGGGERGEEIVSQELDIGRELKELKSTVSELKNAVAEIKAALADLTGPYSYYKPKEEADQPLQVARQPAISAEGSPAGSVGKEGRRGQEVETEKAQGKGLEDLVDILSEAGRVVREEREALTGMSLKQTISLMKMIYEIRRLYPKSSVERILDLMEQLRIVSKEEAGILRTTINIVEQSLQENITPEENTLLMYLLLKNLGVREESIENEVMKTVLNAASVLRTRAKPAAESERNDKSERRSRRSSEGEVSQGGSDKWESQQL
ncbi:MAG: hypothetical protein QXY95_05895 [Thermosphaera sp.]